MSCAKKEIPAEGNVKGIARFALSGGTAISQPGVDEYNPYVLQTGDNYLVLVFASNRSCGGCSGHNLFMARSVGAYNNDAVFPAFENPAVITVAGTPLNYVSPIAFAPTLTGNNVRIFLTNSGGTVQQTAAITPGGSTNTTLTTIANTGGQTSTVIGVEFTGDKLYARKGGTVYSFNHASAGDPLVRATTGHTAASIASVDGAFTSRFDGFFSLIDGTIAGMSLYGHGGNIEKVNTAIAKAKVSARHMTVMRGGGHKGGLMFISGIEAGGTTQDLYVVDGMTVWEMWYWLNPKPPGAPGGGSTPPETTAANPAFSPVAGTYASMITLTITSTTTGAKICYTSNGTDPVCDATPACTTGTEYKTPVNLGYFTGTAQAIACKAGLTNSAVVSAAYVSDVIQPTAQTGMSATANGANQIDLAWTAGSDNLTTTPNLVYEICRTTTSGNCAFATFVATYTTAAGATAFSSTGLSPATTYYFTMRAKDEAGNTSGVPAQFSATTAAAPTVATPTFSPVAGTYNATQNVTISTVTSGAILCYTNDGSTPACNATPACTTGTQYSGTVAVASTATLRALGCRSGYSNSTVASSAYTIDTVAPVISSVAPATGSSPTTTQVSYTVDETCASGSVTWTRTGGTADPGGSPAGTHAQSLTGGELNSGAHNNITLTNNPTLVSGAIYSVAFNCTDAAGNAATTVTSTNVTSSAPSVTWTLRSMSGSTSWSSIAYGNSMYVATRSSNAAASSPDGISWTARTMPSSQTWSASTYGNGTFVAVSNGPSNGAATSTDGINWTARTLPATANWSSVAYGGGQFVAVADASTTAATSPDGITWTLRTLPVTKAWKSVTYGNGKYVVVGTNSTVTLFSTDGISWNQGTITTSGWAAVAYGSGKFVAVGNGSLTATSTDGKTWTTNAVTNRVWAAVAYSGGTFVMISSGGQFGSSTNGSTWSEGTLPTASTWVGITSGIGQVVAVANSSSDAATAPITDTAPPAVLTATPTNGASGIGTGTTVQLVFDEAIAPASVTATTSTACTGTLQLSLDNFSTCVAMTSATPTPSLGNTVFTITPASALTASTMYKIRVTTGVQDTSGNAIASSYTQSGGFFTGTLPGSTWTARAMSSSASWVSTAYGSGLFVSLVQGSTNAASSPDGITWTPRTLPVSSFWTSVTYGNSTFVAVSLTSAAALTSPDGINWTSRTLPTSDQWYAVTYGSGLFVAVAQGPSTSAATSADGITWVSRTLPTSANWRSITYGGGQFVAIANNSTAAATSPDGINWTARTLPATANWRSIAYGNGTFAAVADSTNAGAASTDGITWTTTALPTTSGGNAVAFGNGVFVTVGGATNIAGVSVDGVTWTSRTMASSVNWFSIAFGNSTFAAVAYSSSVAGTSP